MLGRHESKLELGTKHAFVATPPLMCIDMCTDMCADMWIDMCVDMCINMCIDMRCH